MRDVFTEIDRSKLYETVYDQVAAALIEGRLKPGDKLRIRALAEQLGTSVTPVRDAMLSLVRDGALESRSPKDVRVPRIRLAQYEEIRMIRLRVEGLAARMAATWATPDDVAALEALIGRNERARDADAVSEAVRLNQIFHFEIARLARMPLLLDVIRRLWLCMGPIIAEIYARGGRGMIDHHYIILDAIRAGDPARAEQAICEDINAAAETVRAAGVLSADDEPPAAVSV